VVVTCVSLVGFILLVAALEIFRKIMLDGRGRRARAIGNHQKELNRRIMCGQLLIESIVASAFGGIVGVTLGVATSVIHQDMLPPTNSLYVGPHISFYIIIISFILTLSIGFMAGLCGVLKVAFKAKPTLRTTPVEMAKSAAAAPEESATSTDVAYQAARRDLA